MSERVAVYSGTRNVYPQMYTSLKSLLINNQMDRVYLLIEDDDFPYPLPKNVLPVNVSEQNFFPMTGANFSSSYSYMEMLRCMLGTMFQEEDKMLWLDIDTIIDDDITDLFDINIAGYYYAGVMEPNKSRGIFQYINTGVVMCNLALLRGMRKEEEMMAFLNTYKFNFPGQDVPNLLCQGRIRVIGSEYNSCAWVLPCTRPKIIHYAALQKDVYTKDWAYRKYEIQEIPGLGDEEDE